MGKTKQHILEHAWGGFDAPTLDALIQSHSDQRQTAQAAEGLASFAEKRRARMGAAGIASIELPRRGMLRRAPRARRYRDAADVSGRSHIAVHAIHCVFTPTPLVSGV